MRKIILIMFLSIGLLIGVILYNSGISLVHIPSSKPGLMQPDLAETIHYIMNNDDVSQLSVLSSHKDFFYSDTINISLTASSPDADIYYTLDGSRPTTDSKKYEQELILQAEDVAECYVLRAIAVYGDVQSDIFTHSYFVGRFIEERFSTLVFSLTSEPDNLYDYDNGILVSGRMYDEYMEANPNTTRRAHKLPANYNMTGRNWERPVYVEVFTQDGSRIIAQNAGIRVHGKTSRTAPQKSLRLIARREYEPGYGKFQYNFFNNKPAVGIYNVPIVSFDSLILRNGSNEHNGSKIRNALASHIAYEAGFTAVSPQRAAAVFINGEYYGLEYLCVQMNEQFLQDLYNASDREFTTINRTAFYKITDTFDYSDDVFNELAMEDVERLFDIDNLLHYYAFQAYVCNLDLNADNVLLFRYTGTSDSDNAARELDGRWRFIMWDFDIALFSNDNNAPSVDRISGVNTSSSLLGQLLRSPECSAIYANFICDLANEHWTEENVKNAIQQIDGTHTQELLRSAALWDMDKGFILEDRERILEFCRERPDYIMSHLQEAFDYSETYKIVSDGSCKINTLNGNVGTYFVECTVPVTPLLEPWQSVDYWLVNGEKRYGESINLSYEDADINGVVSVSLVTRGDLPPLVFADTYDTGDLCGFTMTNATDIVQNTRGLYLSDDVNNLKKYQFPAMNIRPGSTWEFVGKNSTSIDALLKIALNFNPRFGEVVFLSDEDGNIFDYIAICT